MTVPEKAASYRPDIDGLRAIAVLAVILYHFNPNWLPGGFIGVDIFFVISGYFIIGIIVRELADGKFSLLNFWERRVRRIFPALFVVLTATTIASYYFLLIPVDFARYGQSLMTQSISVSNWWFMRQSTYFASPDNSIPILHTWSLSVEEQFYLLFPLLALLIYPYLKKQFGIAMIGTAVLSFIYSVVLVNSIPDNQFSIPFVPHLWGEATNSSAGFYFIASRFWELLVGGIIAVYALDLRHHWLSEFFAFAGLAIIGAGFMYLTKMSQFPGVAALLPVLGTASVIIANTGQATLTRKILSFPVLVYIGLISYSLYLWHWPLLVFARYQLIPPTTLDMRDQILVLIAIFILSVLTYHVIENPTRQKRLLVKRDHLFLTAITGTALLFAAGMVTAKNNGYPNRIPLDARKIALAMEDLNPRTAECLTHSSIGASATDKPCLLGMQDASHIDFVLWGDSHANATMPAFDAFGRQTNRTGIFFGETACPPFLTNKPITSDPRCTEQNKEASAYIQAHPSAEVFIVSEWREAYKYTDYTEGSDRFSQLAPLLYETLSKLPSEAKITIFGRIQTFENQLPRSLFFALVNGKPIPPYMTRDVWDQSLMRFDAGVLQVAPSFNNVRLINPDQTFCKQNACYIMDDKGFYYVDDSHLSTYGAMQNILPLLLNANQSRK